jgi:1-phosphofructokinase
VAGRAAAAARGLVALGALRAIVSAGSHGVAFSDSTGTAFCPAPPVSVVSPIGAGDALVGGLAQALEQGEPWPAAVSYAVAVASASCEQELAGGVDVGRARELAAQLPAPRPVAGLRGVR